jgi:asparagine synthase (glutamine-hydrolysing)
MCGIVGWVSWESQPEVSVLEEMNFQLIHRGPDAGAIFAKGPMAFGHRRLSIIDLHASANQPMISKCNRYVIVFNGEIYNFKALRDELRTLGAKFKTNGDTEVILEAFKIWGYDCLERLEGMFAFALWDSAKEELFLARDRLGEKPLYYSQIARRGLVFASELRSLRSNPYISSDIDLNAFSQYLTLNYVSGNHSMIKNVSKLLPGHFLVYSKNSKLRLYPYWDLASFYNAKKSNLSVEAAAGQLKILLDNAVEARMVSDVPIGAFLSGGIDSSTIVASMVKAAGSGPVNTFCIGFDEQGYSEAREAQQVAIFLNAAHHELIIGKNIKQDFKKIICSMDEPVADTSFIPFYYLAKFAHQSVKVALSGDGGDELLAGYETYSADKLRFMLGWIPTIGWDIAQQYIDRLIPVNHGKVSFDYKLKQFIKGQKLNADQAHLFWRTIFDKSEKFEIITPDIANEMSSINPFEYHFSKLAEVPDAHYLDRAMYLDLKTWLPDDILTKVDRATMAHSLESRAPFLDRKIVEFCANMPINYKLNGFNKKYLLKISQKNVLPNSVLHQKKKGFNAPLAKWMNSELKDLMYSETMGTNLNQYVKRESILKLWDEHGKGKRDNSFKLFGLTCLSIWLTGVNSTTKCNFEQPSKEAKDVLVTKTSRPASQSSHDL